MVCEKFLFTDTTIVLSSPDRIMAKEFISRLDRWVKGKFEKAIDSENSVYVFLLKK
jgi:hypothetical protein